MSYKEKLTIVKIGGNVIDQPELLKNFLNDFASLPGKKILIHGGGKLATSLSSQLGLTTQMVEGRRITDAETLKVITMVYAGLINKQLVASLNALSCNALGFCGADLFLIPAEKRKNTVIDYGFVGDILQEEIDAKKLVSLINLCNALVIAPLTADKTGCLLNINADTLCSFLSVALSAVFDTEVYFCFEKKGLLLNPDLEDTIINKVNRVEFDELKSKGIVHSGMIPKLESAFRLAEQGVSKVKIGHASEIKQLIQNKNETGTLVMA